MEKEIERKLARRIVRNVAKEFRSRGFIHTKPTFLVRPFRFFVQFVHFHKFSFGPRFRVHLGIRVMNDPFEAIALNGPDFEHAGKYDKSEDESLECTRQLISLIEKEGLTWFSHVSTEDALLKSRKSPLQNRDREALLEAIKGKEALHCLERSKGLLGLEAKKA